VDLYSTILEVGKAKVMSNTPEHGQAIANPPSASTALVAHRGPRRKVYDALVLEARLRQSLASVRSLGRHGLRVAALETYGGTPTFSSRWCQKGFVCPTDESTGAYLRFLEQIIDDADIRVLISSTDANAQLLSQHRDRLEKRVRIALACEPALSIALNKERTLEVAQQLGVQTPRGIMVRDASDIAPVLHEIGLPAIIKPTESWAWKNTQGMGLKSVLVTQLDEAKKALEDIHSAGVHTIVQQYLVGRREAVSFLYAHGRIYARFAQWAKRTMPPLGGTSVLRQSIDIPPDIGEQAERLIRAIELEGYSEVEFRRDHQGKPYLMEINPRLSASVEIAVRAGVDFPLLLYQWANGDQIDTVSNYRTGGWMRYLSGDVETTLSMLAQRGRPEMPSSTRALFDFFTSFLIPMRYDYLDWKDPLPAWNAAIGSAFYWSDRAKNKLFRKFHTMSVDKEGK
jgi:predicted ATP-grasp superfamily ATP-dependent carboligase